MLVLKRDLGLSRIIPLRWMGNKICLNRRTQIKRMNYKYLSKIISVICHRRKNDPSLASVKIAYVAGAERGRGSVGIRAKRGT